MLATLNIIVSQFSLQLVCRIIKICLEMNGISFIFAYNFAAVLFNVLSVGISCVVVSVLDLCIALTGLISSIRKHLLDVSISILL
jgi:hypothetical protein